MAAPAGALIVEGRQFGEGLERGDHRLALERLAGQGVGVLGGIDDGAVAGAAAQVARQGVVDFLAFRAVRLVFVEREQRHRKARRAEAALRTVPVHQRLLYRVQRVGGRRKVFDGEQGLAVEGGQKLDAGIDGAQA